jgi:hypothetical protein
MTKTELKKQQVKAVIEFLINQFDAQIEDADGGRMDVIIDGLPAHFSRRSLEVMFFDSIKLHEPDEFPVEVVERHKRAVALEDKINKAITNLFK